MFKGSNPLCSTNLPYGVMATLQVLVLSLVVRIHLGQRGGIGVCSTNGAIFKRLKKIDCKSIPIVGSVSSNLPCTTSTFVILRGM